MISRAGLIEHRKFSSFNRQPQAHAFPSMSTRVRLRLTDKRVSSEESDLESSNRDGLVV